MLALGFALLLLTAGYVESGKMGMVLFPRVESDYGFCEIYMPYGTPEGKVRQVEARLVKTAEETVAENGKEALSQGIFSTVNENRIQVRIHLTEPEVRPVSTSEVTRIWRGRKPGRLQGLKASPLKRTGEDPVREKV